MIVLALVLLTIVLVFSVAIVLSNPDAYQLSLFRVLVPVTSAGVFFTGFGAALVTITALLLLRTGIRRSRETRRRLRAADQSAAGTTGSTPGRSETGRTGSTADRSETGRSADRDSGPADSDADRPDDQGVPDAGPTGRVGELESGRADEPRGHDPAHRAAASTPDLGPGASPGANPVANPRTIPTDRRPAASGGDDRDEPRV